MEIFYSGKLAIQSCARDGIDFREEEDTGDNGEKTPSRTSLRFPTRLRKAFRKPSEPPRQRNRRNSDFIHLWHLERSCELNPVTFLTTEGGLRSRPSRRQPGKPTAPV